LFVRTETPPRYSDYRRYKPHLRRDVQYWCAYCTIHEAEFGGHFNFHVDHFRLQSLFPNLRTEYSNLYYACSICNSYKSDTWPIEEQIARGRRFLDPCADDYAAHFEQQPDGTLRELTEPAKYTSAHLRLNRKQLVKLRHERKEQEQAFTHRVGLIQENLQKIDRLLLVASLPDTVFNTLSQMREQLQQQLLYEHNVRANFFVPPYEMDEEIS